MSFSGDIKEELMRVSSSARHCQLAELASLLQFCGRFEQNDISETIQIQVQTENKLTAKKICYLYKKLFQEMPDVTIRQNSQQRIGVVYLLRISHEKLVMQLIRALKINPEHLSDLKDDSYWTASMLLVKNSCCKRAFLRGSYLAAGSMSDPNKGYHLELVCDIEEQANQLIKLLHDFELDAKMVQRKRYFVVYLKEGENISDFLNIIEAHKALLDFENTRVLKDMRNRINRRVNCEAANISKTVGAANRQMDSIRLIEEKIGIDSLPANLQEMAYVRLENPDMPLAELGEMLDPPVGKSGVNHRLRKICEIADELR